MNRLPKDLPDNMPPGVWFSSKRTCHVGSGANPNPPTVRLDLPPCPIPITGEESVYQAAEWSYGQVKKMLLDRGIPEHRAEEGAQKAKQMCIEDLLERLEHERRRGPSVN